MDGVSKYLLVMPPLTRRVCGSFKFASENGNRIGYHMDLCAGVQTDGCVVTWPGWFGNFAILVLRSDNVWHWSCGNVSGSGESLE